MLLLILSYPYVRAAILEQCLHLLYIRVAIVVWEEHFRVNGLGCFGHLLWCHGEGLVTWQESHIDIGNVFHLVDILCISGNIYSETINGNHESVVASLRMELLFSLRCVVCRNSLYVPFADGCRVTILHHQSLATENVAASAVGD